jgi:N-acetylmuramoyl-L-alanine amidase
MIIESALVCLSLNIFWEARGEPLKGQYAVAEVTVRRAKFRQRKVCDTVYAPKQFSWTSKNMPPAWYVDPDAYTRAEKVARAVLSRPRSTNYSKGATHYHSVKVQPRWASYYVQTAQIGQHIFYRG